MKRKSVMFAAAAVAIGTALPRPVPATEPVHFAVMGVRLYMSAQEVLAVLYAQGVPEDAITESVHPCAMHAAVVCTSSMTAQLPGGPITIRFADAPPGYGNAREAAFSITYRPDDAAGHGPAARTLAQERFGPFSDAADAAWCAPDPKGACPPDHPRITFRSVGYGAGEMALTDYGLPVRLIAEMPDQGRERPVVVR